MKKRILSMLLCLCMVLALIPATAMAEGPVIGDIDGNGQVTNYDAIMLQNYLAGLETLTGEQLAAADFNGDGRVDYRDLSALQSYLGLQTPTLAVTVDGFEVGKTPADITYSFASTNLGVTFSEEDILANWVSWKYYYGGEHEEWLLMSKTEVFEAGTRYWCTINLDNKGLTVAPAVTMNGKTPEVCYLATRDGVPYALAIGCELGTPAAEPIITLTVPFTTTVKQGGNVAPGETTFDLAIVGSNAGDENISDVTVSGSVTTNGAGDYDGTLTFTGPERSLWRMLSEGAFVQQVNDGKANWTYDDTVWGVLWWGGAAYSNTDSVESTVIVVSTSIDGQGNYYIDWDNLQKEDMTFTNTYTKSVFEPTEPIESDPDLPQTGDNSSMILRTALLLISGSAVIGMIAAGKKKKYNR